MLKAARSSLTRLLRLPGEPHPPGGAPDSIRVFRASRNYYRLRFLGWSTTQFGTLVGIIFSLAILREIDRELTHASDVWVPAPGVEIRSEEGLLRHAPQPFRDLAGRTPQWVLPFVGLIEVIGIGGFLLQLPLTFLLMRMDYELRWYMVSDRSLRIRSGVWKLNETTTSFANLQQVMVTQGPLQRLLSIADVRVQSAGGGGSKKEQTRQDDSLHVGIFHGVDNAIEIRDLIQRRLRHYHEAGLGDPDDRSDVEHVDEPAEGDDVRSAIAEVLDEARKLGAAIAR